MLSSRFTTLFSYRNHYRRDQIVASALACILLTLGTPITEASALLDDSQNNVPTENPINNELTGDLVEENDGENKSEGLSEKIIILDVNRNSLPDNIAISGDEARISMSYDGPAVLLPQPYSVEGYELYGWSTTPTGETIQDNPATPENEYMLALFVPAGQEIKDFGYSYEIQEADGTKTINADLTTCCVNDEIRLYAQWSKMLQETKIFDEKSNDSKQEEYKGSDRARSDPSSPEPLVYDDGTISVAYQPAGDDGLEAATTGGLTLPNPDSNDKEDPKSAEEDIAKFKDTVSDVLHEKLGQTDELSNRIAGTLSSIQDEQPARLSKGRSAEDVLPTAADGSIVESINATWVTEDTEDDGSDTNLYLRPSDDTSLSAILRISYSLSGEKDYNPGDIVITIPSSMFYKRDGSIAGRLVIPYPEDPTRRGDFNWKQIDDSIVITNTNRLKAATQGFFEVGFSSLVPHSIQDMQTFEWDGAQIEVTTSAGTLIGRSSNNLTAQIDTWANIIQATKRRTSGDITVVPANQVPSDCQNGEDIQYVRVGWYMWAIADGTQAYDLLLEDEITDGFEHYIENHDADNTGKKTDMVLTHEYRVDMHLYSYVTVYYPLSQFQPDVEYTFSNRARYTLTEADPEIGDDPQVVTVKEPEETVVWSYHLPEFSAPEGHIKVWKSGNDGNSWTDKPKADHSNWESHNIYRSRSQDLSAMRDKEYLPPSWYGIYPSALNQLRDGQDIEIAYTTKATGYVLPLTYEEYYPGSPATETSPAISPLQIEGNYNRKPVKLVATDTGLRGLVPGTDYSFTAVDLSLVPELKKTKAINLAPDGSFTSVTVGDGTFEYEDDPDSTHIPTIVVEIERNGEWIEYADVSYVTGEASITLRSNGEQIDGTLLSLPVGTTGLRCSTVPFTNAAITYYYRPIVKMSADSPLIQASVAYAFASNRVPTFNQYNSTRLDVWKVGDENSEDSLFGTDQESGYDKLLGYNSDVRVVPSKKGYQSNVDFNSGIVTLDYSAYIEERTIITDLGTYDQAVEDEAIVQETEGTFYDLLPKGVIPLLDTVKLRTADTIEQVYTIEDYRDSGRTLLVVKAKLVGKAQRYSDNNLYFYMDVPYITFQATYSLENLLNYGADLHNVIAFESGNDHLGTIVQYEGEPDDPTAGMNITSSLAFADDYEKSLMTDLDPLRDDPVFVYAGHRLTVNVLGEGVASLNKEVDVNNEGIFTSGVYYDTPDEAPDGNARTVYEGGQYTYRLTMVAFRSDAKDLIFYDSLEDYKAIPGNDERDFNITDNEYSSVEDFEANHASDEYAYVVLDANNEITSRDVPTEEGDSIHGISEVPRWSGTLKKVDVSQLRQIGIEPVVYYSTEHLLIADDNDNALNTLSANPQAWVPATSYTGNMADVKAIAIDATQTPNGTPFELAEGDSAAILIQMRAPKDSVAAAAIEADAHAYNNAYLEATSVDVETGSTHHAIIRKDYTKVGIKEMSLKVQKIWNDDSERDFLRPQNVIVHLYCDGVDTGRTVTLNRENSWTAEFEHVSYVNDNGIKAIYSFVEDVPAGYTASYKVSETGVTITNTHVPEQISLSGTKNWVGDDEVADTTRPSSITVRLLADGVKVKDKKVTADNGWSYSFEDLPRYRDGGVEIEYTIEELSNSQSQLYVVSHGEGLDLINTYHPCGNLSISKKVVNETNAIAHKKFAFTLSFMKGEEPLFDNYEYDILNNNDEIISSGTVTTNGQILLENDQKAIIKDLPMGATYSVTEAEYGGFTTSSSGARGTIVANTTMSARFTNSYTTAGKAQLSASKTLTGRELRRYQFAFELYDVTDLSPDEAMDRDKGELVRTATNGVNDAIVFGDLRYSNADDGKVFRYRMQEQDLGRGGYTYSAQMYFATVTVADRGDGTMTCIVSYEDGSDNHVFANSYHAEGSIVLKARKELSGGDTADWTFTFELDAVDAEGELLTGANALHQQKQNDENGLITWDSISYTEADAGQIHYYRIREITGNDPHVIYDSSTQLYTVQVNDDGEGHLKCVSGSATPIYGSTDETSVYKYAVAVYGIEVDVDINGNPMGITFGPALGPDYRNSYKEHSPSGATDSGYAHRCIHNDSWSEIVQWNDRDPYVYEQCIEEGCTKSVPLNSTGTNPLFNTEYEYAVDGDGVSAIYDEIMVPADTSTESYQHLRRGGGNWNQCRLRAMLNGADADTYASYGNTGGIQATEYTGENTLFAAFPAILRSTIGIRATVYQGGRAGTSGPGGTCYDRLWILSTGEANIPKSDWNSHTNEGPSYPYTAMRTTVNLRGWTAHYTGTSLSTHRMWTRSINTNDYQYSSTRWPYLVMPELSHTEYGLTGSEIAGVSPAFALQRHYDSYIDFGEEIVDWAINEYDNPVFRNQLRDGSLKLEKIIDSTGATGYDDDQVFQFKMELGNEYDEEVLTTETITKISKTANIGDDGTGLRALTGSDFGVIDEVTIDGARSLTIDVWVSTYSSSQAWLAIYDKNQTPTNTNYNSAAISHGRLGGGASGTSYAQPSTHKTYTVDGDTAKFYFTRTIINSYTTRGYGYYAVVSGDVPTTEVVHHDERTNISLDSVVFSPSSSSETGDPNTNSIEQTGPGCYDINMCLGYELSISDVPAGIPYRIYEETPAGWVLVGQNGNAGTIASLEESDVIFTNKYSPGSTSAVIQATKLFNSQPCGEGAFSFELWEGDTKLQEKSTLSGGVILFDPIEYSSPGIHTYTIKELAGNDATVEYDNHDESITVDVSDQGDGQLITQVSYDSDGAVFANKTKTGQLRVSKEAIGYTNASANDSFNFSVRLIDSSGVTIRQMMLVTIFNADGTSKTSYASIPSSGLGDHVISLCVGEYFEIADIPAGAFYEVSEISSPSGWSLSSSSGTQGNISPGLVSESSFVNMYSMFGQTALILDKVAEGFTLEEGTFEFELRDSDGVLLQKTRNSASDNGYSALIEFDSLTYESEGTYTYTIREKAGTMSDVVYDTSTITATVDVHDIGGGQLQCDVSYDDSDNTFVNTSKNISGERNASLTITKEASGVTDASSTQLMTFDIDVPVGSATLPANRDKSNAVKSEYTLSSAAAQDSQNTAHVTFDSNGGYFDDHYAQKNVMAFSSELTDNTLILHSPNISDDGELIGGYFNSTSLGTYSEIGNVYMPGANSMHVELTYAGVFQDANNGWDFSYVAWDLMPRESATESFNVYNSQIYYEYNSTDYISEAYGYYAVVTGYGYNSLGEYAQPSHESSKCSFAGWYTTSECLDGTEFDFSSYSPDQGDITVYAKWLDYDSYSRIFKTDNIDDNGVKLSPCHSRDEESVSCSIPGASGLHIDMTYSGSMPGNAKNGGYYGSPDIWDEEEVGHTSFDVLGTDAITFYSSGGYDYGYYIVVTPYAEEDLAQTFVYHTDNLSDTGEALSNIEYSGTRDEWYIDIPTMTSLHVSVTYSGGFQYYAEGSYFALPESSSADEILHEEFDINGSYAAFYFETLYDDSYGCYITITPTVTKSSNDYVNISDGHGVVNLQPGETITINALPTDVEYSVSERGAGSGWELISAEGNAGELAANEETQVLFTNRYTSTGSWQPVAKKRIVASGVEELPEEGAFEFIVKDNENNWIASGINDAAGNVIFDSVNYTAADDGVEHVYIMQEVAGDDSDFTYDQREVIVTVTPHDDGAGNMTCDVVYADNPDTGPVFFNTKNAETTSLYVYKSWTYNGATSDWPDNTTVEVELLRGVGEAEPTVVDTVELSSTQQTHLFQGLDVTDSETGAPVTYSVREAESSIGRDTTVTVTDLGEQGKTHLWAINNGVWKILSLPDAGTEPDGAIALLRIIGMLFVVTGTFLAISNRRNKKKVPPDATG